ncbi:MAG: CPBP family intramembrane metalloprotease [Lachnospiraceae bacterium]|nr:CPBP family intramembrane metalloprotease [Lachnospiraceae bacterium]
MEYNKKVGTGRKFVEGIALSFEIMVLFVMLQVILTVAVMLALISAYVVNEGGEYDYYGAMLFVSGVLSKDNFMVMLTVVTTAVSAAFSVSIYWAVWGRKKSWQDKQYLKEKVLRAKPVAMICIASVGLYYLAILIAAVIAVVSPDTMEEYNEMMESALGGNQVLAMLAAVLLAPVNEECIMRGLILKNLQRFFSTPVVIIIQAVMFGIFHGNWVQGLYVIPVGAALGYVAIKSRSVIPCIGMHLFYNFLSFIVGLLPEFCQTGFFAIAAVVVCTAAVWLMGRQYNNPADILAVEKTDRPV